MVPTSTYLILNSDFTLQVYRSLKKNELDQSIDILSSLRRSKKFHPQTGKVIQQHRKQEKIDIASVAHQDRIEISVSA